MKTLSYAPRRWPTLDCYLHLYSWSGEEGRALPGPRSAAATAKRRAAIPLFFFYYSLVPQISAALAVANYKRHTTWLQKCLRRDGLDHPFDLQEVHVTSAVGSNALEIHEARPVILVNLRVGVISTREDLTS